MSKKRNKTKRQTGSSKRSFGTKDRLILLLKKFGLRFGIVVFIGWLGLWFVLSGTFLKLREDAQQQLYVWSADAGFSVEEILVEGRENVDKDVLKALINIQKGDPIFSFEPHAAKSLIERLSWVETAHVERRLPRTIYIGLVERVPAALWQYNKKVKLIDIDGRVLTDTLTPDFRDFIIVVGEKAHKNYKPLFSVLDGLPDLEQQIDAVTHVGARRWNMTLKNGIVVKLPDENIDTALERLMQADTKDKILDKNVLSIDLRQGDRIIVKPRHGAVMDYQNRNKEDI